MRLNLLYSPPKHCSIPHYLRRATTIHAKLITALFKECQRINIIWFDVHKDLLFLPQFSSNLFTFLNEDASNSSILVRWLDAEYSDGWLWNRFTIITSSHSAMQWLVFVLFLLRVKHMKNRKWWANWQAHLHHSHDITVSPLQWLFWIQFLFLSNKQTIFLPLHSPHRGSILPVCEFLREWFLVKIPFERIPFARWDGGISFAWFTLCRSGIVECCYD